MIKNIKLTETLIYYDAPELLLGIDEVDVRYLCLLVECNDESDRYLCAPVSKKRYNRFIAGDIDLRNIYKEPEVDELYYIDFIETTDGNFPLNPFESKNLTEAWLPEPGFFFEKEVDESSIVEEAREKNRAIIHFSLNPPEAREETKISAEHLIDALTIFQSLLKYAYKKSLSSVARKTKILLDNKINYETEVFAFSPGSFTIHMQSKTEADLVGHVEISKALQKLDELTHYQNESTEAMAVFKENKGHLVNQYNLLLERIIDYDLPLSYTWTTPESTSPAHRQISRNSAIELHNFLNKREELRIETKELIGTICKVDTIGKKWTIISEEDDKKYSGEVKNDTLKLSGITTDIQRYLFICEECIEEQVISKKEKKTLRLTSFNKF
ncbi:MAG: hypothetical protein B6244_04155 [Candidatus Cloacimonetes bacterium 4572_55]|nr:MAG: hypothetical protein B6244_04155 [Candidatus Cloacimonetes bacterium 4572_55]